jgi:ribosomal protein S18 acetylase RimI-like enzyme
MRFETECLTGSEIRMESSIETARTSDFLNIAALDRISWESSGSDFIPDGEHVWRVWCEHATVLVVRTFQNLPESADIAGALVMFPTQQGQFFLHKIMVHPACRGAGLGTQLMDAGLQRATVPVLLTVNPENQAAVHVYEKLGYRVRELVQGYYRPHEHRYVMIHQGLSELENIELATEE